MVISPSNRVTVGVVFHFPLFLLTHASPIFGDMQKIGKGVYQDAMPLLSETYLTLEALLRLIDPAKDNPILDWKCVGPLLEAAEKYQIKRVFNWFEKEVTFTLSNDISILHHPILCLGLAERFGLRYLIKVALRQAVMMPIEHIKLSSYISARMVEHLFTLRTTRIKMLCDRLLVADCDWRPCERHGNSMGPSVCVLLKIVSEPSLKVLSQTLESMRDDDQICYRCCWPYLDPTKAEEIFRMDDRDLQLSIFYGEVT
jgi:hypothetical protein